jgi:hypothetical protein
MVDIWLLDENKQSFQLQISQQLLVWLKVWAIERAFYFLLNSTFFISILKSMFAMNRKLKISSFAYWNVAFSAGCISSAVTHINRVLWCSKLKHETSDNVASNNLEKILLIIQGLAWNELPTEIKCLISKFLFKKA